MEACPGREQADSDPIAEGVGHAAEGCAEVEEEERVRSIGEDIHHRSSSVAPFVPAPVPGTSNPSPPPHTPWKRSLSLNYTLDLDLDLDMRRDSVVVVVVDRFETMDRVGGWS